MRLFLFRTSFRLVKKQDVGRVFEVLIEDFVVAGKFVGNDLQNKFGLQRAQKGEYVGVKIESRHRRLFWERSYNLILIFFINNCNLQKWIN
jgi:hypothetical protein